MATGTSAISGLQRLCSLANGKLHNTEKPLTDRTRWDRERLDGVADESDSGRAGKKHANVFAEMVEYRFHNALFYHG